METRLKTIKNWNELKTEIKKNHPHLTETDLIYTIGKEQELIEKLKIKLGKTTTEVIYLIERLQFAKSQSVNSKHYNLLFETNLYDKVYVRNKINFRLN